MPKTYKTEIIGYTFEELSESVKQRLHENDDFESMIDYVPVEEGFRENLINSWGAEVDSLEVCYDVSYTQGAGACCVANLDINTVIDNLPREAYTSSNHREPLDLHIVSEKHRSGHLTIESIEIVRCGRSNFYNHENTCRVEIQYTYDQLENEYWAQEEITAIEEYLTVKIRDMLMSFHSDLQDYYEEASSFEVYCEVMNKNSEVYTESGKVVDPVFIQNSFIVDGYQLALGFDEIEPDFD